MSRARSPCWLAWNACAVPEKLVVIAEGMVVAAAASTAAVACPSATPGRVLKEIVTDGSCPEWVMESGPIFCVRVATALKGTRSPFSDLTSVSYTHLRAHETRHDLVCRLLLE